MAPDCDYQFQEIIEMLQTTNKLTEIEILNSIIELISERNHIISCISNVSSILYHHLENLNWVGFYFKNGDELLLGPFCGKPACLRIPIGKGVCGYSAKLQRTIIVPDVHHFDGHIACDPDSNSEIVIPLFKNSQFFGVLDIDSPIKNRFRENDKRFFENIVKILMNHSEIDLLKKIYSI